MNKEYFFKKIILLLFILYLIVILVSWTKGIYSIHIIFASFWKQVICWYFNIITINLFGF